MWRVRCFATELNEAERVVEKCTLCEQRISQGELPQCVSQCAERARYFDDIEQGIDQMVGTLDTRAGDILQEYTPDQVHHLPNVDNSPAFAYILRKHGWKGEDT